MDSPDHRLEVCPVYRATSRAVRNLVPDIGPDRLHQLHENLNVLPLFIEITERFIISVSGASYVLWALLSCII